MPFDFNSGDGAGGGPSRAPIPPSPSKGGFQNRPAGFSNRPAGPAKRPDGFSNHPSGFQNQPERPAAPPPPGRRNGSISPRTSRPHGRRRPAMRGAGIPWERVLPVLGIIALLVLCVVFRDAITDFLTQLLVWAVIVLIIALIFKSMLFGGRRR